MLQVGDPQLRRCWASSNLSLCDARWSATASRSPAEG
jgi:hypothetical protein